MKRVLVSLLTIAITICIACGSKSADYPETLGDAAQGEKDVDADNASSPEKSKNREVVFLDYSPRYWRRMMTLPYNVLESEYEEDEDQESIYAFAVALDYYSDGKELDLEAGPKQEDYETIEEYNLAFKKFITQQPADYPQQESYETEEEYKLECRRYKIRKSVELMEKEGFIILADYPYCYYDQDEDMLKDKSESSRAMFGLCAVAGTLEDIRRVFDNTEEPLEGWYCYAYSIPRPDYCFGAEHQVKISVPVN